MSYIINRLREPSTRLALSGILYAIAPVVPVAYSAIVQGVALALAGHAAVTPDPK